MCAEKFGTSDNISSLLAESQCNGFIMAGNKFNFSMKYVQLMTGQWGLNIMLLFKWVMLWRVKAMVPENQWYLICILYYAVILHSYIIQLYYTVILYLYL